MNAPVPISSAQAIELQEAGQLAELGLPKTLSVQDGKLALQCQLPRQSVSLFVIRW